MRTELKIWPLLGALLTSAPALSSAATDADSVNPYAKDNNSWISISGEVKSVSRDRFELDYGKGSIIVEMDDGDRDADAYKLIPGDQVSVDGKVDDDLFERTTIEASSVYVEKLGVQFYANPTDEEDYYTWYTGEPLVGKVLLQGWVTGVSDTTFTLNSAGQLIVIDTESLSFNPLDDKGYTQIDVGDYVRVKGEVAGPIAAGMELNAESAVVLVP